MSTANCLTQVGQAQRWHQTLLNSDAASPSDLAQALSEVPPERRATLMQAVLALPDPDRGAALLDEADQAECEGWTADVALAPASSPCEEENPKKSSMQSTQS